MDPIFADDWERMAREQLETAEILATHHRWRDAFLHGGFAVELALKCRIMRVRRLARWPKKGELLTHDLIDLARFAGSSETLLHEVAGLTEIGLAWLATKDWNIEARYDPKPFPPRMGDDIVTAVGTGGLLEWLLKP